MLAALTLVSFLLLLDDTAVALALPAISDALGLGFVGLEWVVNAYTLPLAALMLFGGQLADRHGARRVFLIGLAVFVIASGLAGLAGSSPHATVDLLLARALQGVGAALVAPAALSLISGAFPGEGRGLALGIWSGVTAAALGLGPLLGALVTETLGWAWIFYLNVPLGAAAWWVCRRVLPRGAGVGRAPLDVAGAAASALALSALLLALVEGNDFGWGSARIVTLLVVAVAAGLAFLRIERRAENPLLDLRLLSTAAGAGPSAVILLATAVMCSLFFFLALFLQTVLGSSTVVAGLQLLPLTGAVVVAAPLAGRFADRAGPRAPATVGMALLAIALVALTQLDATWDTWSLLPWLTLAGAGIGLTTAPVTTAALDRAAQQRSGSAAGVFNTARTTGLAVGIAVMGAVIAANVEGPPGEDVNGFVQGFSDGVLVNAGIAVAAAAVAGLTLVKRGAAGARADAAAALQRP